MLQALKLITDGLTTREIYFNLVSISESTIKNHSHCSYENLGNSNRTWSFAHLLSK